MTRTMRILLVDDDVSIQRAVAPLLRSRGYEVDVVGTGAEATNVVSYKAPDLVVLDLLLPKLSGLEVLDAIRGEARTKGLPVLVLTARGNYPRLFY